MIERTFDYRIVNRLASWKVRVTRECLYLIEKNGDDILGLWSFEKYQDGVRIHADMTPKCRGKSAIESAQSAFQWIFDHLPANIIFAGIPADNKPACQIAVRSGMQYVRSEYEPKQGVNDIKNVEYIPTIRWFHLRRS